MRVLFITPFFEPAWSYGGIANTASKWAHAYAACSATAVHVYTTTAGGYSELNVDADIPKKINDIDVIYFSRYRWTQKRYVSLTMLLSLIKHIPSFDIVHIVGLWTFGNMMASRICMLYNIPYVVSLHGLLMPWAYSHHKWRKKLFMTLVERQMLKRAEGIICSSEMEKRNYIALNISNNVKVISNISEQPNIDIKSSREHFRRKHQLDNSIILLFSGRIVENKGLHLTVAAFSKIAKSYPQAKLVVVGPEEDDSLKKVKAQIRTFNLEHRFCYMGMLTGDDYWNAMAGSDLFVLNSYSENFGNVVTEALSIGLPVLISDQVGVIDLVMRYGAGKVSTLDVDDIANKMMKMLAQPEKLQEMGRRGITLVHENCTSEVVGPQLRNYFEEIVEIHKLNK